MKKYVIGFDLGGTNSVLALVDKELKCIRTSFFQDQRVS